MIRTPEAWLAWVPGGLPDGFGASVTAIPAIANTTTATADIAWLTGSSDARGRAVDQPVDADIADCPESLAALAHAARVVEREVGSRPDGRGAGPRE